MKCTKVLSQFSSAFKFDNISNIPPTLIEESFQSEYSSALQNSNTYWDNFDQNIRRSNVLKAQIEKQCRTATRVS